MIEEVTADIAYTVDTGEKLVNETFGPNNIRRRRTGKHELKRVTVRNGRRLCAVGVGLVPGSRAINRRSVRCFTCRDLRSYPALG